MKSANPFEPQPTYASTMASDSSISSVPSLTPPSYSPNAGASRPSSSATSVSSSYDHRKQADGTAVMQALADPALAELVDLIERIATACQMKRDKNGARVRKLSLFVVRVR